MAKAPAFQFYPNDWLGDVELQAASASSRGIWINSLCRMWHSKTRGELSGTPTMLARILSCTEAEFSTFLDEAEALGFCYTSRGPNDKITVRNRRMYNEEKEREKNRLRQKRHYDKRKPNAEPNEDSDSDITPHSSSSSSSSKNNPPVAPPKKAPKKQSRKKPATDIPDTFKIDESMTRWFSEQGFHADIKIETQKFINHAKATGRKLSDWVSGWRNWMIKAEEFWVKDNNQPGNNPTPRTYAQHQDAEMRDRAAMLLEEMQNDAEMSQDGTAKVIDLLPEPEKKSTGIGYPGYSVGGGYGSDR